MADNKKILSMLEEFRHIGELYGEVYRERSYRRAILNISRLNYTIKLGNLYAEKIPGVGEGIAAKIEEFLRKGSVAELAKEKQSKRYKAYEQLGKIAGLGPATISELTRQHIYTIEDLAKAYKAGKVELTHMQQLGLAHWRDLAERIPRAEVAKLASAVCALLPQGVQYEISGSYRRGAPTSGDIDIIATAGDGALLPAIMDDFAAKLRKDPNYVADMSQGAQRYTFLYRGAKVRQIDILLVPQSSYWPAVCYFTGSGNFNELLRGRAKRAGYRLNQIGLYKIDGKKLRQITVSSEQDIFATIGVKYIPPEQRNY